MDPVDFTRPAGHLADLVRRIRDDQLGGPTPCPDYTLGDLLHHVSGFTIAFTAAARKSFSGDTERGPVADGSQLPEDWRTRIPADLDDLVHAWKDPAAWEGMTRAASLDMPGEIAGLVALDEVVIHSWDIARATGQPFEADDAALEAVRDFVSGFSGPGKEEEREGLFGPEIAVPADAPPLDRVLGMAGRDPGWTPPS